MIKELSELFSDKVALEIAQISIDTLKGFMEIDLSPDKLQTLLNEHMIPSVSDPWGSPA